MTQSNPESWIRTRWLSALSEHPELRSVIRRGRVLSRRGLRHFAIQSGLIRAEIAGGLQESHRLTFRMPPIDDQTWQDLSESIAQEALFVSDLLRGQLSRPLAERFDDVGHSLFPFDLHDLTVYCTCASRGPICEGAIAAYLHIGEAFESDPMKLLLFRGRRASALTEAIQSRRPSLPSPKTQGPSQEWTHTLADGFWSRGPLPTMSFRLQQKPPAPDDFYPIMRALGPAPGSAAAGDLAHSLSPLWHSAQIKLDRFFKQPPAHSLQPRHTDEATMSSLEDLLLEVAHHRGSLKTKEVSDALGLSMPQARAYLQQLVEQGLFRVEGRTRAMRYIPIAPPPESSD